MSNFHANDKLSLPAPPRPRGRFDGMLNVVRFNWPWYAAGAAVASAAALLAFRAPITGWLRIASIAGACVAVYLLAASLAVSHLIYDRSALYRFKWASRWAGQSPRRILNLHSGFDETSAPLREVFAAAELEIVELHDPARMTEPSIARARRYQERTAPPWLAQMTRPGSAAALPAADASIDAVFAVLAAHEVRVSADRQKLFGEITRILRSGCRLILIEHLRDLANFMVFGLQFVHFYSRSTWLDVARSAGLVLVHEERITPFVGLFVFEKPQGPQA